ncbi:exonuclease [Enterobacter hormaechei]|uniref:exonuclease n=1 Tax=Enterobacter hormaechei TaxID=158836 RepID=UPI00350FE3A6
MEFFHFIKATQKSGKEDAVIWFTSKTEARANLQLDVELEEAGIETGRGKDYQKPIRTDFPVYDDLPEESTVDYAWCKRYELDEDQRTWKLKLQHVDSVTTTPEKSDSASVNSGTSVVEKEELLRPLARLRLPQRVIAHLLNESELKEISEEQHIQIGQIESDEDNLFIKNLLLAVANVPGIKELSPHVEWKMISAIKTVFAADQVFAVETFEEFINEWINDADTRALTIRKWVCDNKPAAVKNEEETYSKNPVLITVATLPLRQRILAQFISDQYAYHIDADQKKVIQQLEMDMDNSYVQNMLLAAENVAPFKNATEFEISKVVEAIKTIFPLDGKRPELSVVIQFFQAWFGAEHIDRGLLVKEWSNGNRVSCIQRTESGANAGGGNQTDRNPDLKHDLDTLDLEIALATLPMDFNIYDIPGGVFRRAKEIVSKKESPFKEWSKALRGTPGILDYSRAAIFALIRSAHPEHYLYPARLSGFINANLTESNHAAPTEEALIAARHTPEVSWANEISADKEASEGDNHKESCGGKDTSGVNGETQPVLEKVGKGLFSIEGLITNAPKTNGSNTTAEYTNNVPMEETGNDETPNGAALSEGAEETISGASAIETYSSTAAINNDTGHHNYAEPEMLYTHLMVDIEAFGKKADSPVVSIGAVFFDPSTGNTGSEFYKVISLESSMASGGVPDASTIIFWLKASPEARSELVMDDAIPLDDALLQLNEFIAENAANGPDSVQVWGNGATYDNVLLEASYDRVGIPCPWKFWNNRDVRTIVELGKAVGCKPRYEIPFEGEPHKAISDALHQVKYVSAIWQRLTEH